MRRDVFLIFLVCKWVWNEFFIVIVMLFFFIVYIVFVRCIFINSINKLGKMYCIGKMRSVILNG